jgi:hypothetical protein
MTMQRRLSGWRNALVQMLLHPLRHHLRRCRLHHLRHQTATRLRRRLLPARLRRLHEPAPAPVWGDDTVDMVASCRAAAIARVPGAVEGDAPYLCLLKHHEDPADGRPPYYVGKLPDGVTFMGQNSFSRNYGEDTRHQRTPEVAKAMVLRWLQEAEESGCLGGL